MRSGGTQVRKQARRNSSGTMIKAVRKRNRPNLPPRMVSEGKRKVGRNLGGWGVADSNITLLERDADGDTDGWDLVSIVRFARPAACDDGRAKTTIEATRSGREATSKGLRRTPATESRSMNCSDSSVAAVMMTVQRSS